MGGNANSCLPTTGYRYANGVDMPSEIKSSSKKSPDTIIYARHVEKTWLPRIQTINSVKTHYSNSIRIERSLKELIFIR